MATGQQLDIPAPRPWRLEGQAIWDADGACIVPAFNPASMATRRLIVEAVNCFEEASLEAERLRFELNAEKEIAVETGKQKLDALFEAARLRDLVRRLVTDWEPFINDGPLSYPDERQRAATIREAKAALAKEVQP